MQSGGGVTTKPTNNSTKLFIFEYVEPFTKNELSSKFYNPGGL